jgi:hypothetical protein
VLNASGADDLAGTVMFPAAIFLRSIAAVHGDILAVNGGWLSRLFSKLATILQQNLFTR